MSRDSGRGSLLAYDGATMTEWLLLLLGVVLTVGTAFFVAAEFSLVALDRPTVQKAVDAGEKGARSPPDRSRFPASAAS